MFSAQSQQLAYTLNGCTIRLVRVPEKDTVYHVQYRYTLTLPDGTTLFGKTGDTCGLPKMHSQHTTLAACLLAFAAVCMKEEDTSEEYFYSHTPAELEWCRSYACEQLGYEVSEEEETLCLR